VGQGRLHDDLHLSSSYVILSSLCRSLLVCTFLIANHDGRHSRVRTNHRAPLQRKSYDSWYMRSPAAIATFKVLSRGARGHAQRGSYEHEEIVRNSKRYLFSTSPTPKYLT
jgi:hypothetical protein